MLSIGEVEETTRIDDLITSTSITRTPILDFENLDFKIASGLRKNPHKNLQKRSAQQKANLNQQERSLSGRQIAWMTHGFIKSSIQERQRSSLRHKVERNIISGHWHSYKHHIGESVQDASWKVGRIEKCVASLRSRDCSQRQEIRLLQIEIDGPETSRAETQRFSFENEKSRRRQTNNKRSEQKKSKRKTRRKCQRQLRKTRLQTLDHEMPMFVWRFVSIQAWAERTRKAKGWDDLVHLLRQVHHSEIRKVIEKVGWWRRCKKKHTKTYW